MRNSSFRKYYIFSCIGCFVLSFYPLLMGIRTVSEMLQSGTVPMEKYPKYVIPYTPISLALIFAVFLMPLFHRLFRKFDFCGASVCSVGVFFLFERLMETKILVQAQESVSLESWQMSLCVSFEMYQARSWEAVDVLLGGYSPAFKLHFYIISVVIILSILNCVYGFAKMIRTGDKSRQRSLIIQAVCSAVFLGMCIWACFTAFYRTWELTVSAVSAALMMLFFIVFGVTMGAFTGSFTLGRKRVWSVFLPALVSSLITLIMYIGEMILLRGGLYRFGSGPFFRGLPAIVLAPADILVILLAGCISGGIFYWLNKK
ncbi:MAG: hypothetical protein NC517_02035 [Firmicutes bacterium]|nr:hypothetical protein [Bacillota bacterium]